MNPLVGRVFLTRFAMLFGGRLTGAVITFISSLLIVRHFGSEGLAEIALLISAIGILGVFLGAGFNRVGGIFAAAYATKQQLALLKGYVLTGSAHIIVGSVAAVILVALLAAFPGAGIPKLALIVCAGAAGAAGLYLSGSIMIGLKQQPRGLLPDSLLRPMLFIAILLVLTRTIDENAIVSVAIGYVATIWMALGLAVAVSWRWWVQISAVTAAFERPIWRRAAYPWAAISLSWDYLIDAMILITGLLAQRYEVAILYVCFRFRVLAGFGLRSILMLFIPEIVGSEIEGDSAQMKQRLMQINLLSCAYVGVVLIVLALTGRWLLGLFGNEIADGYAALMIVALALVPSAVFGPAPQILAIHNLHLASAIIMGAGLAMAVALLLLLFPTFGINGAAAAYLLANFAVYVALWGYVRRRIGIDCSVLALKASLSERSVIVDPDSQSSATG